MKISKNTVKSLLRHETEPKYEMSIYPSIINPYKEQIKVWFLSPENFTPKLLKNSYDSLNRLSKTTEPNGKETSYTFDQAGNRITETIKLGTSAVTTKYTYNEQNRLMSTVCQSGSQTVTDKYRYDNNGNTISKTTETVKPIDSTAESKATVFKAGQSPIGDKTCFDEITLYEFDVWNQLIKTTVKDKKISYSYNGEGYRVSKDINGQTTNYLYEADKVVLETDGADNQTAKNVYGLNLLTRTAGNDTMNYMYNGHADVTALLNQEGTVTATYYYDAFGNIVEQTGNVNNNITYAGYQYDGETGLYYLNARMYDPKIARFLQEDTYAGQASDPLSLNLYTYCHNNPIAYTDPTGHAVAKVGTRGDTIQAIQEKLNKLGYNVGKADGVFGEKTKAQVMKFQKDNGLTVDGMVGNQTLTEIYFEQSKQRAAANGITLPEAQKAKVGQLSGNVSIMTDAKFNQAISNIVETKSKTNGGSVNTGVKNNQLVVKQVNIPGPIANVTVTPQKTVYAASTTSMIGLNTVVSGIVAGISASKSTNAVSQGTGNSNTSGINNGIQVAGNIIQGFSAGVLETTTYGVSGNLDNYYYRTNEELYFVSKLAGNFAVGIQGTVEAIGGGAYITGTGGVGALLGGAALVTHGVSLAGTSIVNVAKNYSMLRANTQGGSKGGKPQKGKEFRGGSKSQRDNWYGYDKEKDFVNWWHRKGKAEFGGDDIQDKNMAKEAYDYWVEIGKPKVK